jgi:aspartyl protease family protein
MPDRNRSNSPWDPQPGRNQHDMPPPKRRRPYWLWLLVAATATAALLYLLSWQFPGVLSDGDTQPYLAHHVILLVVLGSALMAGRRTASAGSMVRYAAIWIIIGVVAILGYSYRADFKNMQSRVIGELRPDLALTTGSGDIAIRRSGDGHFRLTAIVDGKSIRFLVDTGASLIALTRHDAQSLGFDTERLTYGLRLSTANGTAWAAGVSLGEVVVGSIRARDVNASVSRDGLPESLLGLTFLNRLSGYEVRGDTMILKR